MKEWPEELDALVEHIESAIDEINGAVVEANELEYAEIAVWLEWLGEELEDLRLNVLHAPPARAENVTEQ